MKKFVLSLIALAAVSTTAYAANRNEELRDTDTYMGQFADEGVVVEQFAIPEVNSGDDWLFANGEYTKDPMEARRLDEKNG